MSIYRLRKVQVSPYKRSCLILFKQNSKVLITHLWQTKRIKPDEVLRIKEEIKEPLIIAEDKIELYQKMLEAVELGRSI